MTQWRPPADEKTHGPPVEAKRKNSLRTHRKQDVNIRLPNRLHKRSLARIRAEVKQESAEQKARNVHSMPSIIGGAV